MFVQLCSPPSLESLFVLLLVRERERVVLFCSLVPVRANPVLSAEVASGDSDPPARARTHTDGSQRYSESILPALAFERGRRRVL